MQPFGFECINTQTNTDPARAAAPWWDVFHCLKPLPTGDNKQVEKVVRIFRSFQEADEADARADAHLSPEERLKLVIELRDRRHPDAVKQGLARVCRVVELESS
jgi:hypothetical protein